MALLQRLLLKLVSTFFQLRYLHLATISPDGYLIILTKMEREALKNTCLVSPQRLFQALAVRIINVEPKR